MSRIDFAALIPGIMESAITGFNKNEMYLLTHNVSERCICAKFAGYLERELYRQGLLQYRVDVEYNRNTGDTKRLHNKIIVVDLIVHIRGKFSEEDGNLICIEMKKTCNRTGLNADKQRLQDLVGFEQGYNYLAGYMILIGVGKKSEKCGLRIESEFKRK
ncbi:MAG: hypothetical protein J5959_02570 [Butyrivibrio sp.]|nr:hypothetical protein [Butyrivibrio sp.]